MADIIGATFGAGRSGEVRPVEREAQPIHQPPPEPEPPPFCELPAKPLLLRVYEIADGATWWIAAPSIWDAFDVYRRAIRDGGLDSPDDTWGEVRVEAATLHRASRVRIDNIDGPEGCIHSAAWLAAEAIEACVLGCSEW